MGGWKEWLGDDPKSYFRSGAAELTLVRDAPYIKTSPFPDQKKRKDIRMFPNQMKGL